MRKIIMLIVILSLLPFNIPPRVKGADIYGVVTLSNGSAVEGVQVILTGRSTGKRTFKTGKDGRFAFPEVHPGSYSLDFGRRGFKPCRWDYLMVEPGKGYRFAVNLQTGKIRLNPPFMVKMVTPKVVKPGAFAQKRVELPGIKIHPREPESKDLMAAFMKIARQFEGDNPQIYNKLADSLTRLVMAANQKEIEQLQKEAAERSKADEAMKAWHNMAKMMMAMKKLLQGLSPAQIQQLAHIPREFGFNQRQTFIIIEGMVYGYMNPGNHQLAQAAWGLIQTLGEQQQNIIINAILEEVARLKGYKSLSDALSKFWQS